MRWIVNRHKNKLSCAAGILLALSGLSTSHAAPVSLVANGNYFTGWSFSNMDPPPGGSYNCGSSGILPASTVLTGVLADSSVTVSATGVVSNWVDCFSYPSNPAYTPTGNGLPAQIGLSHSASGDFTATFDKPLLQGTVLAVQDMDSNEFSHVTFRDCNGNAVSPAGFDPIHISSNYVGPPTPATSQYNSVTGTWNFAATTGSSTPNDSVGVIINSPGVCSVLMQGPTTARVGNGGFYFYLASPLPTISIACVPDLLPDREGQTAVCTITSSIPAITDLNVQLTGLDGSHPRYSSTCGSSVVIPAGETSATCTITATPNTVPGDGDVPITLTVAESSDVTARYVAGATTGVTVRNDDGALPVPTLGVWSLLGLLASLGGVVAVMRRRLR